MDKKQLIFEDLLNQLTEWSEKYSGLESRLPEIQSSLKTSNSEGIEILHPEIKLVEMKMAALRESKEELREDLIQGLKKAVKDLKEAYVKASFHSSPKEDVFA